MRLLPSVDVGHVTRAGQIGSKGLVVRQRQLQQRATVAFTIPLQH